MSFINTNSTKSFLKLKIILAIFIFVMSGFFVAKADIGISASARDAKIKTRLQSERPETVLEIERTINAFKNNAALPDCGKYCNRLKKRISELTKDNQNIVVNIFNELTKENKDKNKGVYRVAKKYAQFLNATNGNTNDFFNYIPKSEYASYDFERIASIVRQYDVTLPKKIDLLNAAFEKKVNEGDRIIKTIYGDEGTASLITDIEEYNKQIAEAQKRSAEAQKRSAEAQKRSAEAQKRSAESQEVIKAIKTIKEAFDALKKADK